MRIIVGQVVVIVSCFVVILVIFSFILKAEKKKKKKRKKTRKKYDCRNAVTGVRYGVLRAFFQNDKANSGRLVPGHGQFTML